MTKPGRDGTPSRPVPTPVQKNFNPDWNPFRPAGVPITSRSRSRPVPITSRGSETRTNSCILRFFEYVSPCGVDLPVRKRRFGSSWAPSQRRRPRTNGRSSTFSSAPVPYHLDATSCRVTRGSFEPISRYCAKRARTPAKRLVSHVATHCCRSARTIPPVAPARCAHIPSSRSMPSLLQVLCLFGA